jgi:hypothetical protein
MDASGQLETRIGELQEGRTQVELQLEALAALSREVALVLERREAAAEEPAALV